MTAICIKLGIVLTQFGSSSAIDLCRIIAVFDPQVEHESVGTEFFLQFALYVAFGIFIALLWIGYSVHFFPRRTFVFGFRRRGRSSRSSSSDSACTSRSISLLDVLLPSSDQLGKVVVFTSGAGGWFRLFLRLLLILGGGLLVLVVLVVIIVVVVVIVDRSANGRSSLTTSLTLSLTQRA